MSLRLYCKNLPQGADGALMAEWCAARVLNVRAVHMRPGNASYTSCYLHLCSEHRNEKQIPELISRIQGARCVGSDRLMWVCYSPDRAAVKPLPPPPVPEPKQAKVLCPPPRPPSLEQLRAKLPPPPPPLDPAVQAEMDRRGEASPSLEDHVYFIYAMWLLVCVLLWFETCNFHGCLELKNHE